MRTAAKVLFLVLGGLVLTTAAPAQNGQPAGGKNKYAVKVIPDITYFKGEPADADRHKLDLYLPEGKKEFPVMFFIHGGGWTQGDRKKFDKFAETFASQGIGVVATTYRLSPKVQHPAHIEDVAQAFAWTVENIDKYGGRKDQIFVSGHSAGGQLAALLCTNETFLNKHKLSLKNIKGCIPISGVFVIDGSKKENVWGKDPEGWKQASPVNFVSKNNPPFLILFAEKDGKNFHDMGKQLAELLKKEGVEASWREMEGRNHGTIVYNIHEDGDATSPAIVEFIRKHQ